MNALIDELQATLPALQSSFRVLEGKLPGPVPTSIGGRIYPRYREMTAGQAALQKMARYISGLRALIVLLLHRHLQEDGTLKRTLDELGDDIMFLVMQPHSGKDQALHQRFLEGFFAEEFDPGVHPMESKRKRKRLQRREVRDYINARIVGLDERGSRAAAVIYQGYSGYVHADSPRLMEMWDWHSRRYELDGIRDGDLFASHVADATNYFVRGFYSLAALASTMGEQALFTALKQKGDELAGIAARA